MKVLTRERSVPLPAPAHDGKVSLERALLLRRSERHFSARAVQLSELSQLLWAAQGLTDLDGRRTTPSAGASYPLEVHVAAGAVAGLESAHYRYLPRRNILVEAGATDLRAALARAAYDQEWMAGAAAIVVLTAVAERTAFSYGERGRRYVELEAGCAAQNLQLQAAALGLGSVVVGAFDGRQVAEWLGLPSWEEPLVLLPVGWPAEKRGGSC
jgi:SagB-type dehydrogenase family enzyme